MSQGAERRIVAPGYTVSPHNSHPPQPRYNNCIMTRPLAWPCALPHAPRASRSYRGLLMVVSWRRLNRVVTESWPYRGPWLGTHACYVATQFHCIVTQIGNWAVAHSISLQLLFFFFSLIIFFIIPTTEKLPKYIYIYIYSFSSKPNKFIKIYFIKFLPILHNIKPYKKFLHIIFFSFNS